MNKEIEICRIVKDVEGKCCIHIENEDIEKNVGWNVSEKLEQLILDELRSHLGGEFKDEFDAPIQLAIDAIESCNRWD